MITKDTADVKDRKAGKSRGMMSRFLGVLLAAAVAMGTLLAGAGIWFASGSDTAYSAGGGAKLTIRPVDEWVVNSPYYVKALSGTEYSVYREDGETPAETDQVDANKKTVIRGKEIEFNFLKPGTYKIKETKAPDNYIETKNVYTIVVDDELSAITYMGVDGGASGGSWDAGSQKLTVIYKPVLYPFTVKVRWYDNNNQDGLRPDRMEIDLWSTLRVFYGISVTYKYMNIDKTAYDGSDSGSVTFMLPLAFNGGPVPISGVDELVPNGYTCTLTNRWGGDPFRYQSSVNFYADDKTSEWILVNRHTPKTVNIRVNKDWEDEDPSKRGNATVNLYRRIEGETEESLIRTRKNAVSSIDGDGDTVASWDGLPVYASPGRKITYRIEETQVDGYEPPFYSTSYDGSNAGTGKDSFVASDVRGETATFTIRNTQSISAPVTEIPEGGAVDNAAMETDLTAGSAGDLTQSTSNIDGSKTEKSGVPDDDREYTGSGEDQTAKASVSLPGAAAAATNSAAPATVTQGTGSVAVTDSKIGNTVTVKAPSTGDRNNTLIWIIAAIAAAGVGITAVAVRCRRKRGE